MILLVVSHLMINLIKICKIYLFQIIYEIQVYLKDDINNHIKYDKAISIEIYNRNNDYVKFFNSDVNFVNLEDEIFKE